MEDAKSNLRTVLGWLGKLPLWITAAATVLLVVAAFMGLEKVENVFRLERAEEKAAHLELRANELAGEIERLEDFQKEQQADFADQQVKLWKHVCSGVVRRASNLGASSAATKQFKLKFKMIGPEKNLPPEWRLPHTGIEALRHITTLSDLSLLQKPQRQRLKDLIESFISKHELVLSKELTSRMPISEFLYSEDVTFKFPGDQFNGLLIRFFHKCKAQAPEPDTIVKVR